MDEKEYKYYVLFNKPPVARKEAPGGIASQTEWFINGKWQKDEKLSLALNDALMDYGDYSVFDYDDITYEEAMRIIGKTPQ